MKSLRILGLALVASLALVATPGAASASGGLEADSYPTELYGFNNGNHAFSNGLAVTTCSAGTLEKGTLEGPSTVATATPGWSSCTAAVNAGNCKLEFHPGTDNSFDIGPPGCGPMTVKVGSCTMVIGSQTGLPATYENVGQGSAAEVRIKANVGTLKYTQEGPLCSKGPFSSGGYEGEWKLKGRELELSPVGIHATDGFNGFFPEAGPPRFTAEKFPISVAGDQEASKPFTIALNGGKVTCGTAQFSSELSKATSSLPVGAALSSCAFGGETGIVVDMNSCYFSYGVEGTFWGTTAIGCKEAGDSIEVIWPKGGYCVAKFSSQSPTGSSNLYYTIGSGSSRYVLFSTGGSAKFTYTREGFCQILGKTGSDGNFTGNFALHGP